MKKNKKEMLEYQVQMAHFETSVLMGLKVALGRACSKSMNEYIKRSNQLDKLEKKNRRNNTKK